MAAQTISIANAHANDRADPEYYVSLSSTLLVAWSISGLGIPALATVLTPVFGPKVFMYLALIIAALYGSFVTIRLFRREPTPVEETEPYQQVSAQVPLSAELAQPPCRQRTVVNSTREDPGPSHFYHSFRADWA